MAGSVRYRDPRRGGSRREQGVRRLAGPMVVSGRLRGRGRDRFFVHHIEGFQVNGRDAAKNGDVFAYIAVFCLSGGLCAKNGACYSEIHPNYQKIYAITSSHMDGKGESSMRQTEETCPYCEGEGYFQLLLGGTESCPGCAGTGKRTSRETVAAGAEQG